MHPRSLTGARVRRTNTSEHSLSLDAATRRNAYQLLPYLLEPAASVAAERGERILEKDRKENIEWEKKVPQEKEVCRHLDVWANMGCQSSKQASLVGENRPQELAKCAAVSEDVRWSWLRSRTLFTFAEIRALWQAFVKTASSETRLEQLGTSAPKAPICSVESKGKGSSSAPPAKTLLMDKAQFLRFCDSNDKFRVSEVVGAFASRLFDVLDDDGDGYVNFETIALGLSKLLKVCVLSTAQLLLLCVRLVFWQWLCESCLSGGVLWTSRCEASPLSRNIRD